MNAQRHAAPNNLDEKELRAMAVAAVVLVALAVVAGLILLTIRTVQSVGPQDVVPKPNPTLQAPPWDPDAAYQRGKGPGTMGQGLGVLVIGRSW